MHSKPFSHNLMEKDELEDIKADGREIFVSTNLREVDCKAVDWIQQANITVHLGDFMKTEINLPVL
jgi:hypothetical protein